LLAILLNIQSESFPQNEEFKLYFNFTEEHLIITVTNILNGEDRTIMQKRMQNEIDPEVYKKNIGAYNELYNQTRYNRNEYGIMTDVNFDQRQGMMNNNNRGNYQNYAPPQDNNNQEPQFNQIPPQMNRRDTPNQYKDQPQFNQIPPQMNRRNTPMEQQQMGQQYNQQYEPNQQQYDPRNNPNYNQQYNQQYDPNQQQYDPRYDQQQQYDPNYQQYNQGQGQGQNSNPDIFQHVGKFWITTTGKDANGTKGSAFKINTFAKTCAG